jgi:SAM-dependent methyltransferase
MDRIMTAEPSGARSPEFFWQREASPDKLVYLRQHVVGPRVLDIGCGQGWYTTFLRELGYDVTPIDPVRRVEDSRRLPGFVRASLPHLPFADGCFDTVLVFDVLEHVPQEAEALRELRRVTRRRVILSVPNEDDGFLPNYGLCLLHRRDKTHVREYSPATLRQRLSEHGFEVDDVRPYHARHMPLVAQEFFRHRLFRRAAAATMLCMVKLGLVRNPLPGDWFCAASVKPDP